MDELQSNLQSLDTSPTRDQCLGVFKVSITALRTDQFDTAFYDQCSVGQIPMLYIGKYLAGEGGYVGVTTRREIHLLPPTMHVA